MVSPVAFVIAVILWTLPALWIGFTYTTSSNDVDDGLTTFGAVSDRGMICFFKTSGVWARTPGFHLGVTGQARSGVL
jgi:hypothetical protein